MALDDFKTQNLSSEDRYREYPDHEYNSRLENLVDDLQHRFPEEVEVDFIECSPNMDKHFGMAYYKSTNRGVIRYIRMSEKYIDAWNFNKVEMAVLHEMAHIYFHQKGYKDITERDPRFTWVLGRLGALISEVPTSNDCWEDCLKPFLE